MTRFDDKAALCEHALLALAFADAAFDNNPTNQIDVLRLASNEQLIAGFCYLVGSMRLTIAAGSGESLADVNDAIRHALMAGAE